VGGAAAGPEDRQQPAAAQDRDGRRPLQVRDSQQRPPSTCCTHSQPTTARRPAPTPTPPPTHPPSVTGRFERLKEVAVEYAFLLKVSGQLAAEPKPGSGKAAAAAVASS
jgi:hypothetical protein